MQLRQAIVSSPGSRALKENELVSSSDGIDDALVKAICRWSPGRSGLSYGQKQSINFFQPDPDTYALSRSVGELGRLQEDGRRIISKVVLFELSQLELYRNNIALLSYVLQSSGLMNLQPFSAEVLPLLEVPDRAFASLGELARSEFAGETERVGHAVALHHRVVVLGLANPLAFMCSFLASHPMCDRLRYSFSTGLKVEEERQFSIQFFPESDPDLVRELAGQQIRTISLDSWQMAHH